MTVPFSLNGRPVQVEDLETGPGGGLTLLDALRDHLGVTSAKDGCAPQGQCGCCTVLVDGAPRVACVTPLRRVAGREVTTVEGLDGELAARWADAMAGCGGSQCGFCTPGIVVRLASRLEVGSSPDRGALDRLLAAHLCRCTGWAGIVRAAEAATAVGPPARWDSEAQARAEQRATLETGAHQRVGPDVALGAGGFAADTVPPGTLVAVPDAEGDWVLAPTLAEARRAAGKVQGRRTTAVGEAPLSVPPGEWDAVLCTSWVEPAYLETDTAWCVPGGEPATVLANGGAFGAKRTSPLPAVARRLADEHGAAVVAHWSREDCVRHGPKRPPVAGGMRADGTGVLRVVATAGIADAVRLAAPDVVVEELEVPGPLTDASLRAAGWAEAVCLSLAAGASSPMAQRVGDAEVEVRAPGGGRARVGVHDGALRVRVDAGDPLHDAVLRSYVEGAVHMALGWVTSESLSVDTQGSVGDLTIRSFGVLGAAATPPVEVEVAAGSGDAVAVGDAVFAATAAAIWLAQGTPPRWPTGSLLR